MWGKMQSIVVDYKVDYAFHVSDHLSLLVEYEDRFGFSEAGKGLQGTYSAEISTVRRPMFKWDKVSKDIEHNYISHLRNCLQSLTVPECMSENFMCNVHAGFECIDSYYSCIVQAISESCEMFIPKQCSYKDTHVCVKNEVFDWNGNVKVHQAAARRAYKLWNGCGRSRNSPVYDEMCMTRRVFKNSLRQCRRNVKNEKANRLANRFADKDHKEIWKEISKHRREGAIARSVGSIDGVQGSEVIQHWEAKYNKMFNERNFENDRINFNRNINCESKNCFIVPESDVVVA